MIIKPLVKRYLNYDDVITHLNETPTGLISESMSLGNQEEVLNKVLGKENLTRIWVEIVLM